MARIFTINGKDSADELTRHAAFEKIDELSTSELVRLSKLSESERARSYLRTDLAFIAVKAFFKIK